MSTEAQIRELAAYIDELSAIVSQAHALIRKAERKMGELIELQEKQTGAPEGVNHNDQQFETQAAS